MKYIKDIIVFIFYMFLIVCIYFIGFYVGKTKYSVDDKTIIENIDTIYNKASLDSIAHNMIKRDSIIYELKFKMNNEIKQSYIISDSNAIELFKKLVTE